MGSVAAMGTASASSNIVCSLLAGTNFDLTAALNCTSNTASVQPPTQTTPKPPSPSVPPRSTVQTYAALGDSVAAGLGLPAATNASSQDLRCGRSPEAYPQQVAQARGMQLVDVACSGATVGDLFTRQSMPGGSLPPQLNTAFAGGTPQLITITAGANDAHWASLITACRVYDCANSLATTAAADFYLSVLQLKLYALFHDIEARSGPPPTVLLTGYYHPLSAQCAGQQGITADEITWINAETDALNQTIRQVTDRFSFAQFVPISFNGHELCSSDPWVQGINDPAPLHPTVMGQQMYANTILAALGR